ncbi:MAG: hypothetical protein U9N30_04745, partial [Campylobacterota bacterium]|nr:hypothetical protein [Campylobacterota bacterium]
DTLFELLMEKISSDMEWIYVSKNSTLSTQMLQKIEEHNIPNATVNVLRHNRVDSNTVNKYLTLRDKIFNIALGHNEALSADQFQILYDTEDYDVHLSLASNTQTPKSIIVKLFTQQDFNIGHCLASNTATPLPFLLQLMLDNTLKMIVSENPTYRDDAKSKIGHMQ